MTRWLWRLWFAAWFLVAGAAYVGAPERSEWLRDFLSAWFGG